MFVNRSSSNETLRLCFTLQVCMGIGIFSTLLFYRLVRQKDRNLSENDGTVKEEQQGDRVEQISNTFVAGKRRNCSKDKDLNVGVGVGGVLTTGPDVESSNKVFESPTSVGRTKSCALKTQMTIARWFKQPQLYQVILGSNLTKLPQALCSECFISLVSSADRI